MNPSATKDYAWPPRIEAVIRAVALFHDVPLAELISPDRTARVAKARHHAMRHIRGLTPRPSTTLIGRWFNRDHTSVVHACRGHR